MLKYNFEMSKYNFCSRFVVVFNWHSAFLFFIPTYLPNFRPVKAQLKPKHAFPIFQIKIKLPCKLPFPPSRSYHILCHFNTILFLQKLRTAESQRAIFCSFFRTYANLVGSRDVTRRRNTRIGCVFCKTQLGFDLYFCLQVYLNKRSHSVFHSHRFTREKLERKINMTFESKSAVVIRKCVVHISNNFVASRFCTFYVKFYLRISFTFRRSIIRMLHLKDTWIRIFPVYRRTCSLAGLLEFKVFDWTQFIEDDKFFPSNTYKSSLHFAAQEKRIVSNSEEGSPMTSIFVSNSAVKFISSYITGKSVLKLYVARAKMP